MSTPTGQGTNSANLTLGVDTRPMDQGTQSLNRLSDTYKKTRLTLDELQQSLDKLNQTQDANLNSTQRQLLALQKQAQVERENAQALKDQAAAAQYMSDQGDKLVAKLEDMVATYGMTKTEILAFRAAQLGVTEAAAPHIAALNQMAEATKKYGVVIKEVSDIEKARKQYEASAKTSLDAQRIREQEDAARQAARTQTILNAQRIREREDAKKEAIRIAEQEAIEEIKWAQTSMRQKVAILEELKQYQQNSKISQGTIDAKFPAPAQADIARLHEYKAALEETKNSHKGAHAPAESLSEALNQISFSSARARSELIVLAHEAVQGRFTRMPASMMVLAEYTNMAGVAFSALGQAVIASAVALGFAGAKVIEGAGEWDHFNKQLSLTNNYAGLTRDSFQSMAQSLTTNQQFIGSTSDMLMELASSGKFGTQSLKDVAQAAVNFKFLSGKSSEEVSNMFEGLGKIHGKVFNDMNNNVADWFSKTNEAYHYLNAQQYEHIRVLAMQGRQQEAIAEGMKLFNDQLTTHKDRVGFLVASYRGWADILQNVSHWLKEIGADMVSGPTAGGTLKEEESRLQSLIEARRKAKGSFINGSKENLARLDALIEAQWIKVNAANEAFLAERNKAFEDSETARLNTLGVQGQRELDYVRFMNKTRKQQEEDKIQQVMESAANINRSNIAAWEKQYTGSKENMEREMQLAIQSGKLKVETEESILATIKGIKERGHRGEQDGRQQRLQEELNDIKAGQKLVEEAADSNMRKLEDARRAGVVNDDTYYEMRKVQRQEELAALTAAKDAELAVLQRYQSKGANDLAATKKRISDTINAYELAKAKLEDADDEDVNQRIAEDQKRYEEMIQAVEKAGIKEAQALENAIEKQKIHNAQIGKSNEGREEAKNLIEKQTIAQLDLDTQFLKGVLERENFDDKSRAAYEIRLTQMERELELRKALSQLVEDGANRQALADLQKNFDKEWKRVNRKLTDDLTSAIVDGGGKGLKTLIRDMEKGFAKLILRPIIQPVADYMTSVFNPNATQAGGSAEGQSGLTGAMGLVSSAKNLYSMIQGGFGVGGALGSGVSAIGNLFGSAQISAFGSGMGMTAAQAQAAAGAYNAAGMNGIGSSITSGSTAGTVAGGIAGIVGGHYAGRALSNGYSAFGGSGNSAVNTGTAIGATIGSIVPVIGTALGAVVGGLLGGAVNRLFGYKSSELTSTGIRGSYSNDVITGQNYENWLSKGGLFRSDKTDIRTTDLTDAQMNSFISGFEQIKAINAAFAKILDVDVSNVDGYNKVFDLQLDKDPTKHNEQIKTFFEGVSDEVVDFLVPNLDKFSRTGETASQTLERLAQTFQTTNAIADLLGKNVNEVFGGIGLASDAARERLVDLAGGLQNLVAVTSSYAQNYLNDQEKIAPLTRAVQKAMAELGASSVVTKQQFKDLVNAQDLSTDAGSKMFIELMKVQDAFAQVADAAEKLAEKTKESIESLKQQNEDLINFGKDSVDTSFNRLKDSIDSEKSVINDMYDKRIDAIKEQAKVQKEIYQKQKDEAQETLKVFTDIFNKLDRAIKSTEVSSYNLDLARRKDAQAYLQSIQGADLAKATGLDNALSALDKPSSRFFKTLLDYQRDQARTANLIGNLRNQAEGQKDAAQVAVDKLEELIDITDKNAEELIEQLEAEREAQLSRLDEILKNAQQQVDIALGIQNGVMSVADAVRQLASSIGMLGAFQAGAGSGFVVNPDGSVSQPNFNNNAITSMYMSLLGRAPDAGGLTFYSTQAKNGVSLQDIAADITNSAEYRSKNPSVGTDTIKSIYQNVLGRAPDAAGLAFYTQAYNNGTSLQAIYKDIGGSAEAKNKSFDVGTNYVPYDMTARVHEGERIVPKADNRKLLSALERSVSNSDSMGMTTLANRIGQMEEKLTAIGLASARSNATMSKLASRWERNGIPIRAIDPTQPISVTVTS